MGEKSRNREIVENLAARVKEHHAQRGESVTADAAKRQVAEVARVRDQQHADGSAKNPNAGRNRFVKREESKESRKASGKIFVYVKKG